MSYDLKYKNWVEKTLANMSEGIDPNTVFEVYKDVPLLREKLSDNPLEYRFHSPLGRARTIDKLHMKIDSRLDDYAVKVKSPSRTGSGDSQVDYYFKWQSCQMENNDLKKKIEEYRVKFDEIDSVRSRLEKEVKELRLTADTLKKELQDTRAELEKQKK